MNEPSGSDYRAHPRPLQEGAVTAGWRRNEESRRPADAFSSLGSYLLIVC